MTVGGSESSQLSDEVRQHVGRAADLAPAHPVHPSRVAVCIEPPDQESIQRMRGPSQGDGGGIRLHPVQAVIHDHELTL